MMFDDDDDSDMMWLDGGIDVEVEDDDGNDVLAALVMEVGTWC